MGEARRRGTKEERIAQAVERDRVSEAARRERFEREHAERRARVAAMPKFDDRGTVLVSDAPRVSALAALALALSVFGGR